MTLRLLAWICDAMSGYVLGVLLLAYINGSAPKPFASQLGPKSHAVISATLLYVFTRWTILGWWNKVLGHDTEAMYGLQHGRLHLQVPTSMWMNMGYWQDAAGTRTMADACKDLLKMVLREAGFSSEDERGQVAKGTRRPKMLIDLGFGCGDQTMYLMSEAPVRPCDREWWDEREHCIKFDHYIGITRDVTQHRYAAKRIEEMEIHSDRDKDDCTISLYCADAADPTTWNVEIENSISCALETKPEIWVLALDTAYHFSPSRWPLVQYAHALQASFMGFDLCLSPTATYSQMLVLRILTTLMGAPWANFVTPDEYTRRLVTAGYSASAIKIVDVSEHVFTPLARSLGDQDTRLKTLGLDIGSLSIAKAMFSWWGRSGVVRGIIVVARR
jgi:hypothetical protein